MIPAVIPNASAGLLIVVLGSALPSVSEEVEVEEEMDWMTCVVGELIMSGGVELE